ncbi:anti-sigma factor [Streptomyces sp. NPDC001046]|uniref:anti-sigma factor n=1 Tax=unclassified Streptomyces TaxID=2593676 RepID=UPI003632476A
MEHTDEETLALMAIGESPSPPVEEHVHACPRCSRELDALSRVVSTMKTPDPLEDDLIAPPPGLWDAIASELQLDRQPADPDPPPPADAVAPEPPALLPGAGAGVVSRPPQPATPAKRRRLGRFSVALAACAALLGAAAGSTITWWVTRDGTGTSVADGSRLQSLQASSAGYARLSDNDGHRTLRITVEGLPRTSGYFEVWLMDRTHTKLVSMGVLGPDGRASLPVPNNIDLREYSVVDVSVQPYNGKPDHSGDSLVRGPYAG